MISDEAWRRWRLILGGDFENKANKKLSQKDQQRDTALDYLYQREYRQRGAKNAGQEDSVIQPAEWLKKVRKLFPESTVEILQKQAIDRYQLTQLLTDAKVLKQSPANMDLVQTLLSFRHHLNKEVMTEVRRIIREVCDEIEKALSQKVLAHFGSRPVRHLHGGRRQLSHLDWSVSILRNLKHYNEELDQIILQNLYFYRTQKSQLPWDIFIVLDQSGSMLSSIVHSAVLAAIFCRVRSLKTHLILFDTQVVDLSEHAGDPVENLLSVQLGGGTDIAGAMTYTANKITQPRHSIVVLISDFCEGGDENALLQQVQILHESHVTLLGLGALNDTCEVHYDEHTARALVERGMSIATMTPDRLAAWIAEVMAKK